MSDYHGGGSGGSLPDQTGNAGKFLKTDGSAASWNAIPGGGDMLAANNLSDVANAATARTNLGLGNVDNTSDATKNAATATLTNKTISGASNTLSNIPQSAVTNLTTDLASKTTLISAAADPSGAFSADQLHVNTTDGALFWATDVNVAHEVFLAGVHTIANADVAAAAAIDATKIADGSVTNAEFQYIGGLTSDAQTQINAKEPAITAGTTSQYWRGDKSWQSLTESSLTLADNTTNNASTSAHGFLKKLDNSATHFMDGQGNWSSPVFNKTITVETPTASEDITIFFTQDAITISKMVAVLTGSSTPSVTWTVRAGTDRSLTGTEVVTSGTTTTSTTTGSVVTSFNNASISANSFLWLKTTAQSGTVGSLSVTIIYTKN